MVVGGDLDSDDDAIPDALQTEQGRTGLNAVNVTVIGEQGDGADGSDDPAPMEDCTNMSALDPPLIHLAGAKELSSAEKDTVGGLLRGIDKNDIRR